jgi:predicted RNA-binding protein associated with RNAse of E/G family
LYVALDQGYISETDFEEAYALATHCHKKIGGFIRYLIKNK